MGGCGRPCREIELAQNARDVTMDRVLADEEAIGNLPVREAFCQAAQDVALSSRDFRNRARRAVAADREAFYEFACPPRLVCGTELDQSFESGAGLTHRVSAATERAQTPGQFEPRGSGLEWRRAPLEFVDGVFEQPAR